MKQQSFVVFLALCLIVFSCKKESFTTKNDARIIIPTDTLRFDTLFTTTGSVTRSFTIKNDNDQKLKLDHVLLKGAAASPFKINVDGIEGPEVKNIEIEANDSMYVFVTVSIPPNSDILPFVVNDSIEIQYNGNQEYVHLETWGQNANFLRARRITGNVTWNNLLPYVILDGLQVDTTATLTIQKGARIYLHADAPFVVDGTLKITGEKYDSTRVYFQGDRLDLPYKQFPAAWPGIFFRNTSKDNVLNYAVIQNAYQGIIAEAPSINANPRLTLNECIINNIYDAGILGIQTSIKAQNCLVSNCGKNLQLVFGGNYEFTNSTVVTYNSIYIDHNDPVLFVSNNAKQGNTVVSADLNALFKNCIFWGEGGKAEEEIVSSKLGTANHVVNFQNCLWQVKATPTNVSASGMINNLNPAFDSINVDRQYFNFRLKAISPAIDKGVNTSLSIDLDGKPRPVGIPDLGAYEKQ